MKPLWTIISLVAIALSAHAQSGAAPALQVRPPATRDVERAPARPTEYSWHCRKLPVQEGATPAALGEACEFALSVARQLPDFICDQTTTRYEPHSGQGQPKPEVIASEVSYIQGQESYSNVSINGKPVQGTLLDLPGMSSIGEFGTLVRNIFEPQSNTTFRLVEQIVAPSRPALVFDFHVTAEHSMWIVQAGNASLNAPYHGRIWIDATTSHVMRIEQEADLDQRFPYKEHTITVDYADIRLGDRGTFSLPARAKVVACQRRGSEQCYRNTIAFEKCRKFTVNSRVLPVENQ